MEDGQNVFIDKRSIDFSENLLESIMKGLEKSQVAIFFLSKEFKESCMAKHELSTIWDEVIKRNKKFMLVRLDDLDINEIYFGLNKYKYYDFEYTREDFKEIENYIKRSLINCADKKH